MGKQFSNRLKAVSTGAESRPAVDLSREKPERPVQTKEFTPYIIGWILRGGVILSASIILIGFLLLLAHAGGLSGPGVNVWIIPHTMGQVWSGLLALQPLEIIESGLLFLIAVPVVTITISVVAFAIERDRHFVVIAIVVLAILIISMLIGKVGG